MSHRAELIRALGSLLDETGPTHGPVREALGIDASPDPGEYTRVFMLNLYPFVSVHMGAEGMLGGESRDRVAGFWRALGLTPPPEPDHLGALLGLWASLEERIEGTTDAPQRLLVEQALQALLWEHLLPWLPYYLARVAAEGGPGFSPWAELLMEVVREAVKEMEIPGAIPVHLREAPPLPDPRDEASGDGEKFLDALLAPARSGIILTRTDLVRAGGELGLGVRVGERRYTLKALLGQDPSAVLGWLSREAMRQSEAYDALAWVPDTITRFWRERARQTAELLEELASDEALQDSEEVLEASPPTMEAHHA